MNKNIELLNRQLGAGLGYVDGVIPLFQWVWSPEAFYFYRPHVGASWTRYCWADRKGKVWMLAQWRKPHISENEWWGMFHGEFPYPRRGMYYAHPETAFDPGQEPTAQATEWYIRRIDRMIEMEYEDNLREINEDIAKDKERADTEWTEYVQDQNPAFSHDRLGPALHGANVEFQVGGSRDTVSV